jgi:hypothetical protein
MAAACGKPLWLDFDDNLLSVDKYNPFHGDHVDTLPAILAEMLPLACVVTVTTPQIKQSFSGMTTNLLLLPNAFDLDFVSTFKVNRAAKRALHLMWRGSHSQTENLKALYPIINETLEQYKTVRWSIHSGINPYPLTENHPAYRVQWIRWKPVPECFISTMEQQPDLMVACPFNTVFDRSRSPSMAIEAAMAGAACIGPAWWNLPGIIRYVPAGFSDNPDELVTDFDFSEFNDVERATALGDLREVLHCTIDAAIRNPEYLPSAAENLRLFMEEKYTLTQMNKKRWQILEQLASNRAPFVNFKQSSFGELL